LPAFVDYPDVTGAVAEITKKEISYTSEESINTWFTVVVE